MTPARAGARREVSAGGVVVRLGEDGLPRVLLIRDSYRNWGFPKGHLERGERADAAAMREVSEETGLRGLVLVSELQTIDWHFRFRGRPIHKTCHFFLMRTAQRRTKPQAEEGITACRWLGFDEAESLISYENAREVLKRAREVWESEEPVVSLPGRPRVLAARRAEVPRSDAAREDPPGGVEGRQKPASRSRRRARRRRAGRDRDGSSTRGSNDSADSRPEGMSGLGGTG